MIPLLFTRVALVLLLVTWAFLDFGFVRGSYGAVLPGFWQLLVIFTLTLLLMIPSLIFVPLWILPELLRKWRGSIRQSKNCCAHCGQQLEMTTHLCLECGPPDVRTVPCDRSLFISCITIWLGCWLVGTIAGESIARLDEHQFIQSHTSETTAAPTRDRWRPFWGSLSWDQQTATVHASLYQD